MMTDSAVWNGADETALVLTEEEKAAFLLVAAAMLRAYDATYFSYGQSYVSREHLSEFFKYVAEHATISPKEQLT
jgi:hypothetical protein